MDLFAKHAQLCAEWVKHDMYNTPEGRKAGEEGTTVFRQLVNVDKSNRKADKYQNGAPL